MPKDPERRSKRVRSEEDEHEESLEERRYYHNKIMELYEEKRNKFACQDALPTTSVGAIAAFSYSEASKANKRKKSKRRPMKKKKKQERAPIVDNQVTQRLKQFIAMNGGKEAKLVIQKTLYKSDLLKSQNRLSMPMNQVETQDFLTENERRDVGKGLEVQLLGPRLQMHDAPMTLTIWQMQSTDNYVLKTNWNNFVEENKEDLKEKTLIQVWSFRKEEKLCFAIIACNLEEVDDQNDGTAVVNI